MRIGGKRIRKSLKTTERKMAIEKAKELQDKLGMASGGNIRFDEFSTKYLEWAWATKPASAKGEELRLKRIQVFLLSHNVVHLSDITPYHVEQLRADLRVRGRSPATINRYCQLLRGIFYRAIDWEMYDKPNPLKKIRFYREEPCRKLLSQNEVARILEAAEVIAIKLRSPMQRIFPDLIRLAVNTGLRKSELLNLRWSDLREDDIMVKGKGERTRTVPLNDEARRVLDRQPRRSTRIFSDIGADYTSVFRRTVEAIRRRTGIDWHFHLLRHYFGSTLLARGVDIVTIGSLLGHSRAMTTLIYSHTDEKRRREAVLRLSAQNGVPPPKNPA